MVNINRFDILLISLDPAVNSVGFAYKEQGAKPITNRRATSDEVGESKSIDYKGTEINKTRPCVVISPNEMNKYINTLIVAPMTSKIKNYPTRVPVTFDGKKGNIVLDQIRTIDKSRIIKKLGVLDNETINLVFKTLEKIFT